jgi:hypothetical protein
MADAKHQKPWTQIREKVLDQLFRRRIEASEIEKLTRCPACKHGVPQYLVHEDYIEVCYVCEKFGMEVWMTSFCSWAEAKKA